MGATPERTRGGRQALPWSKGARRWVVGHREHAGGPERSDARMARRSASVRAILLPPPMPMQRLAATSRLRRSESVSKSSSRMTSLPRKGVPPMSSVVGGERQIETGHCGGKHAQTCPCDRPPMNARIGCAAVVGCGALELTAQVTDHVSDPLWGGGCGRGGETEGR